MKTSLILILFLEYSSLELVSLLWWDFSSFKNTNIIIQLNNISKAQYKNILFTDTYLCIIGPKAKEAVAAKPNIIPTILIALVRFSQCTLLEIQEYPTAIIAPLPCRL